MYSCGELFGNIRRGTCDDRLPACETTTFSRVQTLGEPSSIVSKAPPTQSTSRTINPTTYIRIQHVHAIHACNPIRLSPHPRPLFSHYNQLPLAQQQHFVDDGRVRTVEREEDFYSIL